MSYEPYPGGASYQPYGGGNQLDQRPPRPRSVQIAVWLMYVGAGLSALSAILILVVSSSIKKAVEKAAETANATNARQGKATLTASQIHQVANAVVIIALIVLLIGVALWLWMAWANGRGSSWARILASVLFGLNTVYLFLVLARAGTSTLFVALGWLVGLGAIIMLWRRESTMYFQTARR